jgi:hypothetical protein
VKTIASTLGVARSNIIERADGKRPKRGPQIRAGDVELAADIRRLVDQRRPTGIMSESCAACSGCATSPPEVDTKAGRSERVGTDRGLRSRPVLTGGACSLLSLGDEPPP